MSATLEKPKPGLAAAIVIPLAIWFVFSVVAIVVLVMFVQRAQDIADDFARIDPGQAETIELSEGGDYRIWLERDGVDAELASASATITGPDGQDIVARDYIGSLTYGDLSAVLTFEVPEAGEYTFEVTESAFSEGSSSDTRFAIGKGNPLGEAGKGILFMILIGTVGFLIALILLIVMLVRRGRSKRRITQAAIQSGSYGGGYGAPGGYGQPGGYGSPGGFPPGTSSW